MTIYLTENIDMMMYLRNIRSPRFPLQRVWIIYVILLSCYKLYQFGILAFWHFTDRFGLVETRLLGTLCLKLYT